MIKNPAITLSRTAGMLLIVLCHVIKYYTMIPGYSILSEVFNCGVPLFIFISGYLYGGKIISNFKSWYLARFTTVALPAILVSLFTIIGLLIAGENISIPSIIAYLLGIQGLHFLNWDFFSSIFSEITSLGHLWFVTIIMLCYLLVPVLQKITANMNNIRLFTFLLLIIGIPVSIITKQYFDIFNFLLFAISYCLGKIKILDRINSKKFLFYTGLLISFVVFRLILNKYYDQTPLYRVYTPFSQCVVGTWIVIFFAYINNFKYTNLSKIASLKPVKTLEKYSFYIYIAHGLFYTGPMNMYIFPSIIVSTLLFLLATAIVAFSLKFLIDRINK